MQIFEKYPVQNEIIDINQMQKHSSHQKNKRSSYKRIPQEKRMQLIRRIKEDDQNIKDVAQEINLNISTCKAILKVYQEEGRVGKKQKRNKIISTIQTFSFFCANGSQYDQVKEPHVVKERISINRQEQVDLLLKKQAESKVQKILDQILEKKKKEEENRKIQFQFNQFNQLQNQNMQYFFNPYGNFNVPSFSNTQNPSPSTTIFSMQGFNPSP